MRTFTLLALLATAALGATSLSGCARGVTFDDAYGRPDATEWTYFNTPAQTVIDAITRYYSGRGVATESARNEGGGVVLTIANRSGSASTSQILVQSTDVEGFQARAQVYPIRRPLPRDVETFVTREE
ncbi:MAG TPA: hypothetical protein VF594_08655 [Rubricoccaceae bacterium]|jgi:hypothetical protein